MKCLFFLLFPLQLTFTVLQGAYVNHKEETHLLEHLIGILMIYVLVLFFRFYCVWYLHFISIDGDSY